MRRPALLCVLLTCCAATAVCVAQPAATTPTTRPTTHPTTQAAAGAFQIRLIVADGEAGEALPDPADANQTLLVSRDVIADAEDLAAVAAATNDDGTRGILIILTPAGGDRLELVTRENIGRRLAIVLEGEILIAPTIRAAVAGNIVISFGDAANRDAVLTRLKGVVPQSE